MKIYYLSYSDTGKPSIYSYISFSPLLKNGNNLILLVNNNLGYFVIPNNNYLDKISVLIKTQLIKSFKNLLITKNKNLSLLNILSK